MYCHPFGDLFLNKNKMLKSLLISSVVSLGFLVSILMWQMTDYDGTAAQTSLLNATDLAGFNSVYGEYDLVIERPSDEDLSDYSFLNKYGEVVPYDEYETLSLEEAAKFVYYLY